MHLIICSNSGPRALDPSDDELRPAAAGGLVPHVLSLLNEFGGQWFYRGDGPSTVWQPRDGGRVDLHPVVAPDHGRLHYEVVSIETLLWLFHYLHDTAVTPVFDVGLGQAWESYREVNFQFAHEAAVAARAADHDAIILVNDYHLLLVPGMLARLPSPTAAQVIYSHHVPWCEPAYFGIIPEQIRTQILRSVLSCDVVVFHCRQWLNAFGCCCEQYLGARIADGGIEYAGRRTRLVAVPFPLDSTAVLRLSGTNGTQREQQNLDDLLGGRRLLARVDRLDLWKNQLRGFAAYAELLQRHPRLADNWCFVAVVSRPRYRSHRHRAYETACQTIVSDINERYGSGTVELDYPDASGTRSRAIAALSRAAAVLVNPTYDGFNLVAKEAVLLGASSAVLLSRTAGAHEYLAPAVTSLDPFDVSGTTNALEAALVAETRAPPGATAAVRESIRHDTARSWLQTVLK